MNLAKLQVLADDVCFITPGNRVTTVLERICHLSDLANESINLIQLHQVKSLRIYRGSYNTSQLCHYGLKSYSLLVLQLGQREELLSSW
ncbi:hypothetical protein Fmac_003338 [Flemingia macrophylla]|uniref:Uncharacterized protein n=1 Tax=Flemingia macrophylla TaxID=520843 RepID=A0ABD1NPD0_9FABA